MNDGRIQIGMSSAVFYGYEETENAAARLREFGLDTCEIFLETFSEYTADFGRVVREKLGGLSCASVHAKGTQFEPDLFGLSVRQQEDAFHLLDGVLAAGEAMGARYMVFHGPGNVRARRHPDSFPRLQPVFARMQETARKHGMEVLWENVSWCALSSPEDIAQARQLLPEQGFVLDLKQANRSGVDPFDVLAAMGDKLRHLHVLDWDDQGKLVLPGEGVMDFPRLAKRLRAMDWSGAVMLEPYANESRDPQRLKQSLCYLREVFAG